MHTGKDATLPFTRPIAQAILLLTAGWIAVTFTLFFFPLFVAYLTQTLGDFYQFPFGSITFLGGCLVLYVYPWLLAWSWSLPFIQSVKEPKSRTRALLCLFSLLACAAVVFSVYAPVTESSQYVTNAQKAN